MSSGFYMLQYVYKLGSVLRSVVLIHKPLVPSVSFLKIYFTVASNIS